MDLPARRSGRKRQTRLSFEPRGSSSPGLACSPPGTEDRLASVRYVHPLKSVRDRTVATSRVSSPGIRALNLLPTPENSSQAHQNRGEAQLDSIIKKEAQTPGLSSPCPTPPKSLPTKTSISEDEDDDVRVQVPSRRRTKKVVSYDEYSSTGPITPSKRAKSTRPRNNHVKDISKSKTASGTRSRAGETSSTRAFSVEIITPKEPRSGTQVSQQATAPKTRSLRSQPSNRQIPVASSPVKIEDEDDSEDEEEEDVVVRPSTARSRKAALRNPPMIELDDSEESEEDIVTSSPAKRRKPNVEYSAPQTPSKRSEQDKLDLAEDLEDLEDSIMTKNRTRGRLADSTKDRRQKQLDILKRRRAGHKSAEESSASDNESEHSASEEDAEGVGYSYISSDKDKDSDNDPGVQPNEDLDRYEEDFLDDEGQLGVPTGLEDVPLEFTRHRYKQPKEYFRDVVEWMVHNELNPTFSREDNVYHLAFMKLNDEVKGRAGSHYVSSAWNIDFKRALEARPEINTIPYPRSEGRGCDACNKTNHPASFDIQFHGSPYLLETLSPVSDEDEDSNDELGSKGNIDRNGNSIPEAGTHFYLGRHCKSKATMAHTLIHWRHNLDGWVVDYLERQNISTKKENKKRKRWSQERKTEHANEVVDMMEEKGEINSLWRDFHLNLKAAREDKEFRW